MDQSHPSLSFGRTLFLSGRRFIILVTLLGVRHGRAEEHRVSSPDGTICVVVSDSDGLHLRFDVDSQLVLASSPLGLAFANGTTFGPVAKIESVSRSSKDSNWENPFGKRRIVPERWNQLLLTVRESESSVRRFGMSVRVFDDGVAFRYELGSDSGPGEFTIVKELTRFAFPDDHRCWAGLPSQCAENQYPETRLSAIPATDDKTGAPYKSVLPLLVEMSHCYVAISESDVRDWAGMFLTGADGFTVGVTLDERNDGRGGVVSKTPCVSPWRVLMIGRQAADLVNSDLIATLATPCQLEDTSWIEPGPCAWDPWWTGVNPYFTEHEGLWARGNTQAHKEYIDFAAEMGWPYQLVDWFWYKNMSSYEVSLNKGGQHEPSPPVRLCAELAPH